MAETDSPVTDHRPEMDLIRVAFAQSEELIDGVVRLRLLKGNPARPRAEGPQADSQVNRRRYDGRDFAAVADLALLRAAARAA